MSAFRKARWITSDLFANQQVQNIFFKEEQSEKTVCPDELKNIHTVFRKVFTLKEVSENIKIRISADDYYKLKINGKSVGQGPAQGYPNNYYSNEFLITSFLHEGENEISAEVYYHGLTCRAYVSGDRKMGFIAEIYSEDTDIIATDNTWEYAKINRYLPSEHVGANASFMDEYDFNITDDSFKKAIVFKNDCVFRSTSAVPLQIYRKYPVSSHPVSGGMFYDFGEELTGSLFLTAKGKKGSMITLLQGEETEDSPLKTRYKMRCGCRCEQHLILSGNEDIYEQYDYIGFRYLTVLYDKDTEISDLGVTVRHYPFDDDYCTLETDDKILKSVFDICKNGVKYGSQEVYVDCPQREKGQYAGDMTVTSDSQVILTGDVSLLQKAIDDQTASSFICKGLMAVTPSSLMQEIADYSLQFPILALRHYEYTSDKKYLERNLEICENIIAHFKQFARRDGLLDGVNDKWNLVDWPVNMRDDYDFGLEKPQLSGCHNVINAFYIGCVLKTEGIRDILGIDAPKESTELINAFNRAFYSEKSRLYTDCEATEHTSLHSNIIPLYFGFNPAESTEPITELIMKKGLVCGVYMSYFLLKGLCRAGKFREAYSIVTSTAENSWYNMVREGGTTCFEAWGKDKKGNTSLCHPWASAPISVIVKDLIPNLPETGKVIINKVD